LELLFFYSKHKVNAWEAQEIASHSNQDLTMKVHVKARSYQFYEHAGLTLLVRIETNTIPCLLIGTHSDISDRIHVSGVQNFCSRADRIFSGNSSKYPLG
jgi:hypothetical protein